MLDDLGARGGGKILIPPSPDGGFIGVDGVLRVHDNTTIEGVGVQSHLRCTAPSGGRSGRSYLFDYGNYRVVDFAAERSWECRSIVRGARTTVLKDAQDFSPGDVVWAFSSGPDEGRVKPLFQFNEVVAVQRNTLTMSRPWAQAIGNPRLAKSSGDLRDPLGNGRRVTKRVQFRNLRLSTAAGDASWDAAGGSLEARFENLTIESRSPFYSNGFSHCQFLNVGGSFGDRFVELAGYSHDNVILNAWGRFEDRGLTPAKEPLISFGENANRNRLSRFTLHADECREAYLFRARDGSDNIVEDGEAHVRNIRGALLTIRPSGGRCRNNIVRRLTIYSEQAEEGVVWAPGSGADEGNNLVEDIKIIGRVRGAAMKGAGLRAHRVTLNGRQAVNSPQAPRTTEPEAY